MQYHYVVFYDSEKKRWGMEYDVEAYFADGHVFDVKMADETGYGWFFPEDDTDEAVLDQNLTNTLYSIVDIIPVPEEDRGGRKRSPIGSIYADLTKEQGNASL